jgi:hypothetical protein
LAYAVTRIQNTNESTPSTSLKEFALGTPREQYGRQNSRWPFLFPAGKAGVQDILSRVRRITRIACGTTVTLRRDWRSQFLAEAVALIAAIAFSFVGVNYDWIPLLQS